VAYPNQLKSQRLTGATPISQAPTKVGQLEQAFADALGVAIDQDFSAQLVIPASQKGVANGIATLDSTGKVPTSQLPALTVAFQGCLLGRSANFSLAQYSNYIPWDYETYDPLGMHNPSVNPERITIPSGLAGMYLFIFHNCISNNGSNYFDVRMETNEYLSAWISPNLFPSSEFHCNLSWLQWMDVGDYLVVNNWASGSGDQLFSGATGNWLQAVRIGT